MEHIGSYEAKTKLPSLLKQVENGERIVITRHGVPVAMLVPPEPESQSVRETISELRKVRHGCRLDGVSVRELMKEGRR